jgi:hypothetical protein
MPNSIYTDDKLVSVASILRHNTIIFGLGVPSDQHPLPRIYFQVAAFIRHMLSLDQRHTYPISGTPTSLLEKRSHYTRPTDRESTLEKHSYAGLLKPAGSFHNAVRA